MNICFICDEYPPGPHGGVGTFTRVMGRALVGAGHQVRVVGLYPGAYPATDYEEDQGVRVWRLRMPTYRYGWVLARRSMYRLIKSWIKAEEINVVDAPDHNGWFAGWPKLPVPLVLRAGGSYTYFAHELSERVAPGMFRLEKWSYRRADAWIAKSRYIGEVTKRLFKLPSGPNATLYNPIDAPTSAPPFSNRAFNRAVFTGTLHRKKGVVSLIDAWPVIRGRFSDAELHIYGKDIPKPGSKSMQSYLQQRLPSELHRSVHFHGHVSRDTLFQALSTARVAVFPSYTEGFAWAPLEAMVNGCPTIYSRLGSGPELIEDGRDGLLVDPDQPAEIAEATLKVLKDDVLAQRLSEMGRARVLSAFSLENLLPMNERFYSNLIRSFRR